MKELTLFVWLLAGFASGVWIGSNHAEKSERQLIADACRYGGSFTLRETGFVCRKIDRVKK